MHNWNCEMAFCLLRSVRPPRTFATPPPPLGRTSKLAATFFFSFAFCEVRRNTWGKAKQNAMRKTRKPSKPKQCQKGCENRHLNSLVILLACFWLIFIFYFLFVCQLQSAFSYFLCILFAIYKTQCSRENVRNDYQAICK